MSSNPCVGPTPRIKTSFFLLSTFPQELISTPKIITFWVNLPLENKNVQLGSNPVPYPEYLYLPITAFYLIQLHETKNFLNYDQRY